MTKIEIRTKYVGPTNTRGSRIKASGLGRSLYIPYPHELSAFEGHASAAKMLFENVLGNNPLYNYIYDDTPKTGYIFTFSKEVANV